MNENSAEELQIKEEETPMVIVDDMEPVINLTRCGRKRTSSKKVRFTIFQIAAKMRQLEELEQNLRNRTTQLNNAQPTNNEPSNANNVNINIEKPTFSTKQILHPLNFVEDLVNYLDKLPESNRTIDTVVDCLKGDASNWAAILKPRWNKIDDFIRDFLDQYWGMEEQSLLKKEILNGRWFTKQGTMCRHFIYLLSQARWLKHKMSDDELVYEIMQHYPKNVQIAWYVSKKSTVLEATEFLKKMDEIELRCMGKKRVKQWQSMQMKYKVRD